ncbi:Ig-like domain-containing protein [Candidatus Palauibacter sp.]|uniref:Ig-like domain-containing protein n=1 Tax=Candidatus Palauibacter sp. TaxID=3101350 RepID=UPI003B52F32C
MNTNGVPLSSGEGKRSAAAPPDPEVSASEPDGLSAAQSFAVNVAAPAPTTMRITPEAETLTAIDQTVQLSAEVLDQLGRPIAGATVEWASEDAAVVTVEATGLVTAVGPGEATLRERRVTPPRHPG